MLWAPDTVQQVHLRLRAQQLGHYYGNVLLIGTLQSASLIAYETIYIYIFIYLLILFISLCVIVCYIFILPLDATVGYRVSDDVTLITFKISI